MTSVTLEAAFLSAFAICVLRQALGHGGYLALKVGVGDACEFDSGDLDSDKHGSKKRGGGESSTIFSTLNHQRAEVSGAPAHLVSGDISNPVCLPCLVPTAP